MAPRTVYVWATFQVIEVSKSADGTWVAQGDYQGERIDVLEADEDSAIKKWVSLARAKDGDETPRRK